jgi:hypothetical protein
MQGVWQGQPQGVLVGVPTSKRPQINNVQYPRIPSKILKGAMFEEGVDGSVDDEAKNLLILNVWSVETPRYLA